VHPITFALPKKQNERGTETFFIPKIWLGCVSVCLYGFGRSRQTMIPYEFVILFEVKLIVQKDGWMGILAHHDSTSLSPHFHERTTL
jgi:hypothetical protein